MSAGRSNEQAAGEAELSFETLMGGILTRFLNLPVSQIDKDIENSIGRVAEFMGLDEGLLVQWTADPSQARPTHFWTIAGSLPAQNGSGTVAVPWVHSQLLLGKVTAIARAADLPSEAAADREFLQQSGRKSLIAVPIKIGGAVIGGLAFATLRTEMQWSAGLMRRLKLVAEIFAGVLERKKRNLELDIQLQFESLLKEISSRFANVRADQVQSTIEEAQRLCCESLCLDRSSLFQCSAADPGTMLLTHLYQRPDLPYPVLKRQDPVSKAESYWRLSEPGYLGEYTRIDCKEMYPWFYEQLRHGKTVVVPDLQALGDEAATDKKNLSSFGTKSSVVVPLFAGYEWLGILTFGAVSQRRDWTESLVSRFQFLADLFTNALARKQADEALCESENRYRGIFEAESDGVLVGDLGSGMFLDANAAAQKMYGYTREEFLGLKLEDISAEPNKTLKSVAAREMHVPLRWHRRKDGSVFPVEVSANFVTHGTRSIYVGAIRDISERKRTEDALRESEERLTLATESAGAGLWSVKLETEEVWLSPRMRELLQLTADEEINYLTLIRAVHPADRDQLLRASRGTVEEGKEFVLEHRVPLPDGKERWIIARGRLHCDAAGKPDRLMGASTDITHRKLAQQRIRESEQRFRQLAENIREVFYVMDPRIPAMEYVSPVYEEVWGRSCQSRYDNPLAFLDAVHPEDRERVRQAFATASTAATVMDLEYRIIRPDGSIRWVRDRAFPVLDESGTVTRLTGLAEDITERKGLEQELNDKLDELEAARDDLKNSNDSLEIERTRYRELFESAPDAYCVTDLKGVVVEANRAAEDLFNFSRAELLGNPLAIFISMPDHQSFFSQLNGLAKRGLQSVARWEMDIQPVKAAPLPVAVTVVVARDAHNQTIGLRWLFRDITERKLAESRLRESEARFRTAADSAPVLIWISGTDKLCTFFNQTWLDFTGRTAEQEMGDGWTTGVHPEDLPGCMKTYDESFAAHRPFTMQYRLRRHDGEYRWLLDHGVPRYEADGAFAGFIGSCSDMTEVTLAVKALEKSEERFRQIAENVSDFIWEVDANGLYTYTSPSVERILGYAPDELVGKMHFYDLFVPETREQMKAAAFQMFAGKQVIRDFPNLNVCKPGERVYLETSGVPILDTSGNLVGYRGADRDVTERKQAEAALHHSWSEIHRLKDRLQAETEYLRTEIKVTQSFGEIIGQSEAVKQVLHKIERVAPVETPVLITGETGTGKELIARAIHRLSNRGERAMIKVNCAALPAPLVESELFGRERGAFTGAMTSQAGRFEVADGSTIFLDEIGELSPETQAKLLRVLQEGEFERLGSPRVRKVNVRLIAATNRDLAEAVRKGSFRQDLYYRLSVFPIHVPPLRERFEDIPALVSAFVTEFASRMGKKITKLPRRKMDVLQHYSWPGNIRELRNVLEHGVILSTDEVLRLPPLADPQQPATQPTTLADLEREHILRTFERTGGRIKGPRGAANLLGINPGTLYSRMRKLGIPNRRQQDDR